MENFIFFQITIFVLLIIDLIGLVINSITKVKRTTPNIMSATDIVNLDIVTPTRYIHP